VVPSLVYESLPTNLTWACTSSPGARVYTHVTQNPVDPFTFVGSFANLDNTPSKSVAISTVLSSPGSLTKGVWSMVYNINGETDEPAVVFRPECLSGYKSLSDVVVGNRGTNPPGYLINSTPCVSVKCLEACTPKEFFPLESTQGDIYTMTSTTAPSSPLFGIDTGSGGFYRFFKKSQPITEDIKEKYFQCLSNACMHLSS
jgi:hypothetical protein